MLSVDELKQYKHVQEMSMEDVLAEVKARNCMSDVELGRRVREWESVFDNKGYNKLIENNDYIVHNLVEENEMIKEIVCG